MDTYFLGDPLLAGSNSDSSTDSIERISLPTFENSIISNQHNLTKDLSSEGFSSPLTAENHTSRSYVIRKQKKSSRTSVKNLQYQSKLLITCSFTPPPQPVVVNTVPELDVVEV